MVISKLNEDIGMETILSIPCYCDIQFDSNEFLTALRFPDHPYLPKIDALIEKLQNLEENLKNRIYSTSIKIMPEVMIQGFQTGWASGCRKDRFWNHITHEPSWKARHYFVGR